jgi:tetratricopeptide (TPR) repeat protein
MNAAGRPGPLELYAQAIEALNRQQWPLAQRLAAQVAPHAPRHGGVHFVAGVAALQMQQVPLALGHLRRAVEYSPGRADYRAQYARALAMDRQAGEAVAVADAAMKLDIDDAAVCDTLGVVYSSAGAHREAAEAFRRAVELMPGHANFRFNLATSFLFHGDLDAAAREFEACVRIDPGYWRAYFALSQLRTQTPGDNHLAWFGDVLQRHVQDAEARLYLHLALAKELEDLGRYPEAFGHYVDGKAAHRARIADPMPRHVADFEAVMQHFEHAPPPSDGFASEEPIFVMGMPRSGTTLVDRILSSHASVHSAGESGAFGVALQRVAGRPTHSLAENVAALGPAFDAWARLGEAYVQGTRPAGTGRTPRFVDKLPHNFLHAGFIARALPRAKLVCLRRDPMDTCLSNFRQLFALESPHHEYAFDLLDTGRYYLLFDRLMAFWRQLVPGRILELRYEDLVEDQAGSTRALLDFCGLPWDEDCLRFEDNAAPVATASAVQVRSGMNRASMQRWKRYGDRLDALRELLVDGGIRIDG